MKVEYKEYTAECKCGVTQIVGTYAVTKPQYCAVCGKKVKYTKEGK